MKRFILAIALLGLGSECQAQGVVIYYYPPPPPVYYYVPTYYTPVYYYPQPQPYYPYQWPVYNVGPVLGVDYYNTRTTLLHPSRRVYTSRGW